MPNIESNNLIVFYFTLALPITFLIGSMFVNIIAVTTAHQEYKDSDCLLNLLLNQDDLFILDTVGLFSNSEIKRLRKKHKIRVVGRGDII